MASSALYSAPAKVTTASPRPLAPRPRPSRRIPSFRARLIAPGERALLDSVFRLRHAVFVRELGWVPDAGWREIDRCDGAARHFGVVTLSTDGEPTGSVRPRLAGYARVLLPDDGFMLHREFAEVLTEAHLAIDPLRAFEVSRVVVRADLRGVRDVERHTVVDHLARAIAGWALASGRSQWLSVCELRHVRALRLRGFRCERIGQVVEYQPGVPVCAVRVNLSEIAVDLRARRPSDYAWYCEGALYDGQA